MQSAELEAVPQHGKECPCTWLLAVHVYLGLVNTSTQHSPSTCSGIPTVIWVCMGSLSSSSFGLPLLELLLLLPLAFLPMLESPDLTCEICSSSEHARCKGALLQAS